MSSIQTSSTTPADRVALVTGASRGIGRDIALRLAEDGYRVVVNYARDAVLADDVVATIRAAGGSAVAVQADISQPDDVQRLFATAEDALGKLSAVVHSAGVMKLVPFAADGIEVFDQVVEVNLRGAFLVLAHAAEHVQSGGRIVALSSSVIAKATPLYGPYIATKAGVEGLVRVLANELRGRNITVNAVAPGPVATELFLAGKSQEQIDMLSATAPLERLGQPDDIARVVSFLLGADGRWVNAQVLRANGGFA